MYQAIKTIAEEQGKTIAQVAKESGVSESALSMMKKRGGKMSVENAAKIAKVLGVSVEELLEELEPVNE